jgi:hypothetical protein
MHVSTHSKQAQRKSVGNHSTTSFTSLSMFTAARHAEDRPRVLDLSHIQLA